VPLTEKGTDDELLRIYEDFKKQRNQEKENRFDNRISKREFLKKMGLLSIVIFLTACGSGADQILNEENLTEADIRELQEKNVFYAPLFDEVEKTGYEENMGLDAKELLYEFIISKEAEKLLYSSWRKVSTPDFLIERGIVVGNEIGSIFEFKNANGGVRYFDKASNRYLKLSLAGSLDERYLKLAYLDTIKGWRAIGIPEEMVAQVQWIEGFRVNGQTYSMMVTPNAGNNLEGFISMIRNNGKIPNGEAKALAFLDDYYTRVLFPMNAVGVIQQDVNFKNIVIQMQSDGKVRFVPIDLAAHPKIIEERIVFQWQYEQLAERAKRRNILMPSFENYLASHPEIAEKVTFFKGLNEGGIFKTSISLGADRQSIHLYFPRNIVGGQVDTVVMDNLLSQLKAKYGARYEAIPQGEILTADLVMQDGSTKKIAFMKTNSIGGKIKPIGGKWGEMLKIAKTGTKYASDALMLMWIATELGEITDPDYRADIESLMPSVDTARTVGKDAGVVFLDTLFDKLSLAKKRLSDHSTDFRAWSPLIENMVGMTNLEAVSLLTNYGIPYEYLIQAIKKRIIDTVVPPAPSNMKYGSVFPILFPQAEIPTSAHFSVFVTDEKEKAIIFWGQVVNADGSKTTVPVSAFTKKTNEDRWTMTPIINSSWSITLSPDGVTNFICEADESDGLQFKIKCESN